MLHHNKKGFFLPLFVLLMPLILGTLYGIMYLEEAKKTDLVGLEAINIIKANDEVEKINIYLDLAAKHSSENALKILASNGGFSGGSTCKKTEKTLTEQEEYVIWNTCPVLNPEREFKIQLKNEFKSFIDIYESSYQQTNYEKPLEMTTQEQVNYNNLYTENTRKAEVAEIEEAEDNYIISLSEISLPVEGSQDSAITFAPKTSLEKQDFSQYEGIYFIVRNNCVEKQIEECRLALRQEYSTATTRKENNILKIKVPLEDYTVKFALYSNKHLPSYEQE